MFLAFFFRDRCFFRKSTFLILASSTNSAKRSRILIDDDGPALPGPALSLLLSFRASCRWIYCRFIGGFSCMAAWPSESNVAPLIGSGKPRAALTTGTSDDLLPESKLAILRSRPAVYDAAHCFLVESSLASFYNVCFSRIYLFPLVWEFQHLR